MAVLASLAVASPLTITAVGHDGTTTETVTMTLRTNPVAFNGVAYRTYRANTQLSHATYAGGTFEFARVASAPALALTPSPETRRWRANVSTAHTFTVSHDDGALTITVTAGLRISDSSSWTPDCSTQAQSVSLTGAASVYIAPCGSGRQTVTLSDDDASRTSTTYTMTVLAAPTISPKLPPVLAADRQWHRFNHSDPHTLTVRASHVATNARLVARLANTATDHCTIPVTSPNSVSVSMGVAFFLSGCAAGQTHVTLLDGTDQVAQFNIRLTVSTATLLTTGPADATLETGADWHTFQNTSGISINVATDATNGSRLAVSLSDAEDATCPATAGASVLLPAGSNVYLAGCEAGRVDLILTDESRTPLATLALTITSSAFLTPDPVSVSIRAEERWHEFRHTGTETLTVIVNVGGGSPRYLAVAPSSVGSSNCIQAVADSVTVPPGAAFYLTGCAEGTSKVDLRDSDGDVLVTYTVSVLPAAVAVQGREHPLFEFRQQGTLHLPGEGLTLDMLSTLAGTYDDLEEYSYEARLEDPNPVQSGRVPILADMTRSTWGARNPTKPACSMAPTDDNLTKTVALQTGDTLHIRACAVGYGQTTIGSINLSDAILGEVILRIFRVQEAGDDVEVYSRTLRVAANDLVLTRPTRAWRVNHTQYDEDNDPAFRIPVEWRFTVGAPYSVPNRARFLGWVTNSPGATAMVAGDGAQGCVANSTLVSRNVVVLQMGESGTAPYQIKTCNSDHDGVSDVAIFYMRGTPLESNLIWRYVFTVTQAPPPFVVDEDEGENAETSLGDFATPTPQPTLPLPGQGGNYYTGDRPEINDADVEAVDNAPRVLNFTVFWDPIPEADGYDVRIDGIIQSTKAFTTNYRSTGYQLAEADTRRVVIAGVRAFKTAGNDGFTTSDGVFVPAHETYYSPWSRDYRVVLTEGGSGLDLALADADAGVGDSPDLAGRSIPRSGLISDAQQNVRELFSSVTGIAPNSNQANALLPLLALFMAIGAAAALLLPMGLSPAGVAAGASLFTLIWGIGGPLFFGVPIAAAAMLPILTILGGVGLLKTKGVV